MPKNGLTSKNSQLNGVKKAKTANGDVGSDNLLKLNKNNRQAPKAGMQRMLFNRLVNRYAIPGTVPFPTISPSPVSPAPTPATTSVIELLTQGGLVLATQAGDELITQKGS